MNTKIRVLVVDDSPFVCRLITGYLDRSGEFEVVGIAYDGRKAVQQVKQLRPDAVTLDLGMPEMDGLQAVAGIMRECPTPVVVITGASGRSSTRTLQAMDMGAVDFVLKFSPGVLIDPDQMAREIVAKLRAASKIRVIRSLDGSAGKSAKPITLKPRTEAPPPVAGPGTSVIVIGSSTGGPLALRELLAEFPADFLPPIVVVQHMPPSFTGVLAAQLNRFCTIDVREAEDGEVLRSGLVLVAPGGFHMLLSSSMRVTLRRGPAIGGHCPSVDVTMESAAQAFGSRVKGVLLTGMGEDGARGLEMIRSKGGLTYAQDAESCVINGMPQKAIDLGVVDHVAPPSEIARMLIREVHKGEKLT